MVGFLPWQKVFLLGQWKKCGKTCNILTLLALFVFMKYGIPILNYYGF